MRLLIVTQAVDLDDPVLGFFHRWIAEFAKHVDSIEVICLKEGRHDLPANVHVHSLGKEHGASRIKYIFNFYGYIWKLRNQYDAVFVHMNSEYVALGGPWWRLWGKKVALWYIHPKTPWQLRLAVPFTNFVFTAQEGSMRIPTHKKRVLGHGIDTVFFSPPAIVPAPQSILFLGRLDPVKRAESFISALDGLHEEGVNFSAEIIGDPTDSSSKYAHDVRNQASPLALEGILLMRSGITNIAARDEFRAHAIYCNLTPSGSFDKTVLEAMACGCVVVASNSALQDVVPEPLLVREGNTVSIQKGIRTALTLSTSERAALTERMRTWVEREHSLTRLCGRICEILSA